MLAIILKSYSFLEKSQKKKYIFFTLLQTALVIFDIIGLLGLSVFILGALSRSKIESNSYGVTHSKMLDLLISFISRNLFFSGFLLTFFFILKSYLSNLTTRHILALLARYGSDTSKKYYKMMLDSDLDLLEKLKAEKLILALSNAINFSFIEVLGAASLALADTVIICMFGLILFYEDPVTTTFVFAFFTAITLLVYRKLSAKIHLNSILRAKSEIESRNAIRDGISLIREIQLSGNGSIYSDIFWQKKFSNSRAHGLSIYLQQFPKYILDVAVVVSFLGISILEFALHDSRKAISLISVFLLCISRFIPSLLRLQSSISIIGNAKGYQDSFLELGQLLDEYAELSQTTLCFPNSPFKFDLLIENLSYTHSGHLEETLRNVSIHVQEGDHIAIVGPSGSGKSSLVDLVLGFRHASEGKILIGGLTPAQVRASYPGQIGYVPQNSHVIEGSILQNITLNRKTTETDMRVIDRLFKEFGLDEELGRNSPGLDLEIGGITDRLSGGQRQKIALIRAIYLIPKLLILDEATSALDSTNEVKVLSILNTHLPKTTIITIVHKLRTVVRSDEIYYLERGRIIAKGTYYELLENSKEFIEQVRLSLEG